MCLKFLEILEKCWFFEENFKPFCLIIKKFEKLDLPTLGLDFTKQSIQVQALFNSISQEKIR